MVAKLVGGYGSGKSCYLLAKIHMVAKRCHTNRYTGLCYLLAKIHMVAKQNSWI